MKQKQNHFHFSRLLTN